MIKYLIEKEFKQIFRNSFLPRMIVMYPCVMMLVLPWAASLEIKNINLSVVDNSHSSYSRELIQKTASSGYFRLTNVSPSYNKAIESIESGESDIVMEIPTRFEQDLVNEGSTHLLIAANTVNGTKGGLGSSYLSSIVLDFASDIRNKSIATKSTPTPSAMPNINIVTQHKYNPHLDYKMFMIPALMVVLLTILCGFLPALNIVSEKEKGTIEQINVTPVSRFTFIMAKLIPYWTIGFVVLSICFGVAALVYGLVPVGHLTTIYFFAVLYVLAISGFGLVISNYSETMQQAMFVMFFFMMILILLSGLFTPINSMPQWAQNITIFNPLKYFIQVMRLVYLKGSGIMELTTQVIALATFAIVFNSWAVISYRKKS